MRKLFLITVLSVVFVNAFSQSPLQPMNYRYRWSAAQSFDSLYLPTGCGAPSFGGSAYKAKAAIYVDSCNDMVYVYNPKTTVWREISTPGLSDCVSAIEAAYRDGDSIRINTTDSSFSMYIGGESLAATIPALSLYNGDDSVITVKDQVRGGRFIKHLASEALTVDNGIVFARLAGGYWVRDISQAGDNINIKWFGANGDGTTDDTQAFMSAARLKKLLVPAGKYSIDSKRIPYTNYILDSGVTFVSGNGEPFLIGKVNNDNQSLWKYKYYNPTVSNSYIFPATIGAFQYNHDVSITYFGNKFYCFWNAVSNGGTEGTPGQRNYMSTSTDGVNWTSPVACFDNSTYSNNPVPNTDGTGQEWQPNAVALSDRMLVVWTRTDSKTASYISVLLSGQTKFTNYRIDISTGASKHIFFDTAFASEPPAGYSRYYVPEDAYSYFPYATQQPYILSSGRMVIPFSIEDDSEPVFRLKTKWASLIYTDNPADTASYTFAGLSQGTTTVSAWEPYISESRNGDVYMHLRNLGVQNAANINYYQEILHSSDGIEFSNATNDGLVGPSSRGYNQRITNRRQAMIFNDATQNNRVNTVVNFSRYGGNDFATGLSLQKDDGFPADSYSNYPQSVIHNDTLYVAYSQFYEPRSIKWYKFKLNAPDDSLLLVPRNRARKYLAGYIDAANQRITLTESKTYELNKPMIVGSGDSVNSHQSFSLSAWVNKQADRNNAAIFDNRGTAVGSDFYNKGIGITQSFAGLGGSGTNVNLTANLNYNFINKGWSKWITQLLTGPSYIGVTIDNPTRLLSVYMDDGSYTSGTSTQFFDAYYYWQAVTVSQNWTDGQTITFDGTTYTFKNTPVGANDVQLDDSLCVSCGNLRNKITSSTVGLAGFSNTSNILSGTTYLLVFFKTTSFAAITSTNSYVAEYTANWMDSPGAAIGSSFPASSGLQGFGGYLYNMRIYRGATDGAITSNVHRYLFNQYASTFGYSSKSSATTNNSYYANISYNDYSSLKNVMTDSVRTEYSISGNIFHLHSNSSAAIETEGDAFVLKIPFIVSNSTGIAATVCSIQDKMDVNTITVDSSGNLYFNDVQIASISKSVTNYITISFKDNVLTVNGTNRYMLTDRPRIYLGKADVNTVMDGNYDLYFDISKLKLNIIK